MTPMDRMHYETHFDTLHSAAAARMQTETPTRNHVLELGVLVGNLCSSFLAHAPLDPKRKPLVEPAGESASFWKTDSDGRQQMADAMGQLLWALVLAAETCDMNLRDCILKKMLLNQKKYPVDLVKGKAGKYTAYSDQTGITKTEGQSTLQTRVEDSSISTVEEITAKIRAFATERLWSRYHTPRSLVLALMGEMGELAELFQWKGDDDEKDGWSKDDLDHVGQEFADVAIYLLRLADVCCVVDIGALALSHSEPSVHD